ncbi:MAG: NUDIX hydrolase [Cyclobacteriaceae bacterium]|nr:NUDIX hydrolase [Cyclobacteriaceae bacterium]
MPKLSNGNRTLLVESLLNYRSKFKEEIEFIPRFLNLLQHQDCFYRSHLNGHITGSAWIINPAKSHTLLLHHKKLNKWLQPGGHADGEENILLVAEKEAKEETGLSSLCAMHENIFDIDIHTIPARGKVMEHEHFDIRYIFVSDENDTLQINHESINAAWYPLKNIMKFPDNFEFSIRRMAEKTISLQ